MQHLSPTEQKKREQLFKSSHSNTMYLLTMNKQLTKKTVNDLAEKKMTLTALPTDLLEKIFKEEYKSLLKVELRKWIQDNVDKIDLKWLCSNTSIHAIEILKEQSVKNPDKLDWKRLSGNPNAIEILTANEDRIYWDEFSSNRSPDTIDLFKKNIKKLNFHKLSSNPAAIYILITNTHRIDANITGVRAAPIGISKNPDINWMKVSKNPNAFELLITNKQDINWDYLCANPNPNAIKLIEKELKVNPSNIYWRKLSTNINASHILEEQFNKEDKLRGEDLEDGNLQKLRWNRISSNQGAIKLLQKKWDNEKELKKIDMKLYKLLQEFDMIVNWKFLSANPKAKKLLKAKYEEEKQLKKFSIETYNEFNFKEKLDWKNLSGNPCAVSIIEEELLINHDNPDIDWVALSANPKAIHLLKKNQDKISWKSLSTNPSIFGIRGNDKAFSSKSSSSQSSYKYVPPKFYL
jgi:hypothetical protein